VVEVGVRLFNLQLVEKDETLGKLKGVVVPFEEWEKDLASDL